MPWKVLSKPSSEHKDGNSTHNGIFKKAQLQCPVSQIFNNLVPQEGWKTNPEINNAS